MGRNENNPFKVNSGTALAQLICFNRSAEKCNHLGIGFWSPPEE